MTRRMLWIGLMAIGCAMSTGESAWAQPAAEPKIRGDVYFVYAGEIYRGHAGDHTFLLGGYTAAGQPEKELVAEHAGGIRAGITASQKAYAKLSAAAKKNPTVAASLPEIDKHQAAILAICDKLDAEAGQEKPDGAKVGEACSQITQHVDAADAAHEKVAKGLKIPPLESGPQ